MRQEIDIHVSCDEVLKVKPKTIIYTRVQGGYEENFDSSYGTAPTQDEVAFSAHAIMRDEIPLLPDSAPRRWECCDIDIALDNMLGREFREEQGCAFVMYGPILLTCEQKITMKGDGSTPGGCSTRSRQWSGGIVDDKADSDEKLRQQRKSVNSDNLTEEGRLWRSRVESSNSNRNLGSPSRNPLSDGINDTVLRWLFYLADFSLVFFEAFEGEKRAPVEFEANSAASKVELER
nr:uncharacterized protein LOC109175453 [Ipomoea batatas]